MELVFKNGNVTIEQHIQHADENLGKIRLVRDGDTEGVWALFSPEGKKKYNDDSLYGETVVAVLCNASLSGVPWGAYVKVELRGDERPVAVCEEQFAEGHVFQYADWASGSICTHYLKGLQTEEYKLDEGGLREYLIAQVLNAPESDVTAALKELLEQ